MVQGFATSDGTARYRARFAHLHSAGFFRQVQEADQLWISSIGLGTYLGEADAATDAAYTEAVAQSLRSGIDLVDSAINYRNQRSERNIGAALKQLISQRELQRDEVVICTKAGYLTLDGDMPADPRAYFQNEYINTGILDPKQVVNMNCVAPDFLYDQLERSRKNLGLETVDVFYIHNPESQLSGGLSRNAFLARLKPSFQMLEEAVTARKIRFYGVATWNGFRMPVEAPDAMNLIDLVGMAREIAGENHHFRFIQMPFNLAMHEAWGFKNQAAGEDRLTIFDAAARLGVAVIGSASISQGNLAAGMPAFVKQKVGLQTDSANAIQFARSAPGITASLIGMSKKHHVIENIKVGAQPLMPREQWESLFG
jgi:aryl-alcohol dehydrogenase-like predicted oxidoreductase